MKTTRYSLHKIDNENTFSFSPEEYSLFKFGDNDLAKKFGKELAIGFINDVLSKVSIHKQIVVVSSPYCFIPTATFAMKNFFVNEVNHWLSSNHKNVVEEIKIHRTITYKEDYGALSAEDRLKLIGNDSFYMDKIFVENKIIIFLDDIRITGSHEKMIERMLEDLGLSNECYLLYFAELVDMTIHPKIENDLNYAKVKAVKDLEPIINHPNFAINTRIVKYILNSNHDECLDLLSNVKHNRIEEIYYMAIGNSYHTIETYKINIEEIKKRVREEL